MDIEDFKKKIAVNVYFINSDKKVPLHKHSEHDEVFYCVKGSGYGVFEDEEVPLEVGKAFIVPADKMHSLRSDDELYISSFLIPLGCNLEPEKEKKKEKSSEDIKNRCSEDTEQKENEDSDENKEDEDKDNNEAQSSDAKEEAKE